SLRKEGAPAAKFSDIARAFRGCRFGKKAFNACTILELDSANRQWRRHACNEATEGLDRQTPDLDFDCRTAGCPEQAWLRRLCWKRKEPVLRRGARCLQKARIQGLQLAIQRQARKMRSHNADCDLVRVTSVCIKRQSRLRLFQRAEGKFGVG